MVRIIKRDGRAVPFNKDKISNAIMLAMKSVNETDENIANEIADDIASLSDEEKSVEEIQDMVEKALVKRNLYDIAKEYIIYRNQRSILREKNSRIFKQIKEKVDCKNIENVNANVNEHAFDGRKKEASDILQKYIAVEMNMPEDIAKGVADSLIYEHDLSEYNIGSHNCLFIDFEKIFRGFKTRNGAVRAPGSFATACQLVAVAFQCQSQVQFGGVASAHIDYDLAPFVKKSFIKHFKTGLKWMEKLDPESVSKEDIYIGNEDLKEKYPSAYAFAMEMLENEGHQASESLYHNLNTLESRAGGQVPFTSINLGRDTSAEGRLVTRWLLEASISGIGKFHTTSIFPISIFSYKKGVNAKPGDPNYDLKQLALKSMSKRIYPNWVNGDWSQAHEDPNNPDTYMATMGCVAGTDRISYCIKGDVAKKIKTQAIFRGDAPFEKAWKELTKYFNVEHSGNTDYMDLTDIFVYDTMSGWVPCHRIIRNRGEKTWRDITFSNGEIIHATTDHPFHIINAEGDGRIFCDDVKVGMVVRGSRKDSVENFPFSVTNVSEPYTSKDYSYDVTTASDHFTINNIYSYNCRTMVGYDRHGLGYSKVGRGNNVPITMILPKLGIEYGIALGKRDKPDLDGFMKAFEEMLNLTERALLTRYEIIKSQSPLSGPFMYMNGTIKYGDECEETVEKSVKHNTLAFGFIGIAETCQALFGKNHANGGEEVYNFALNLVKRIYEYSQEASERNDLNFSCYATPAESLCRSALMKLRKEYGVIPGVTDREYITNSFHVPVWEKVSIFDKLKLEAPFTKFATGGTITYVEVDSTFVKNTAAIEKIIDYAFDELDIPYLAINFPIDTCEDCGYSDEFNDHCPMCGSHNIEQLRRVTGYLTTDRSHFNDGKRAEERERVKHSAYTNFEE